MERSLWSVRRRCASSGRACLQLAATTDALNARHLDYYVCLAEQARARQRWPRRVEWLDRLEGRPWQPAPALERVVLLDSAVVRDGAAAWPRSMSHFWLVRGHVGEVGGGSSNCCGQPVECASDRPWLNGAGMMAMQQADYEAAWSCTRMPGSLPARGRCGRGRFRAPIASASWPARARRRRARVGPSTGRLTASEALGDRQLTSMLCQPGDTGRHKDGSTRGAFIQQAWTLRAIWRSPPRPGRSMRGQRDERRR